MPGTKFLGAFGPPPTEKTEKIGKIKGSLVRKVPGNLRSQEFVFFSWEVFLPPTLMGFLQTGFLWFGFEGDVGKGGSRGVGKGLGKEREGLGDSLGKGWGGLGFLHVKNPVWQTPLTSHWKIKGRFRKRAVLANVPSFRFSFQGNVHQNHPFGNHPFVNTKKGHWEIKGGFQKGGFGERTLVPVFVPGEHPPKPPLRGPNWGLFLSWNSCVHGVFGARFLQPFPKSLVIVKAYSNKKWPLIAVNSR